MSGRSTTRCDGEAVFGPPWFRSSRPPHAIGARYRRILAWLLLIAGVFLAATSTTRAQAASDGIIVIQVDGVITPVIADHVRDALDRAGREEHQALLVELDTPGAGASRSERTRRSRSACSRRSAAPSPDASVPSY